MGIWVGGSDALRLDHNNLLDNGPYNSFLNRREWQALDDGESGNAWDDGYPSGGNYWSDYPGDDNCSGALQDVCPEPDGIGDSPYDFFEGRDNYPLFEPQGPLNIRPQASFTVFPSKGNVTTRFTVDASASADLEDPVASLEVRWDWEDDGIWDTTWSREKTAVHQYASPGAYFVRLQVRDTGGRANQTTRSAVVENTAPLAAFGVTPPAGDTWTTFSVNASASSDLEDPASALEVRWDWEDDGVWDTAWSEDKTAEHLYGEPGSYTIRVQVRDTAGRIDQAMQEVTVGFPLLLIAGLASLAIFVVVLVFLGFQVFRRRRSIISQSPREATAREEKFPPDRKKP